MMTLTLATYLGSSLTEKPTFDRGDWKAASAAVRDYANRLGIGVRDWKGGEIKAGGKPIAFVSYNGKVWTANPAKKSDAALLFDPSAK